MAVLIDDDLSKVKVSLEVNIPEVVDPSGSVPDEMKKSKTTPSDDIGASDNNVFGVLYSWHQKAWKKIGTESNITDDNNCRTR